MSTDLATQEVNLETIVDELFSHNKTSLTLANGNVVVFHQAKFKQIAVVTRLFQTLIDRIPRDKFLEMLTAIADAQANAMVEGRSAQDISMNTVNLLEKALGQQSLLLTVFTAVLDLLPEFIPQFCSMGKEDFENLDFDEAVLVASGVVAVNYSFFTQKLPPLVKSVMLGWNNKRSASGKS